MTICSASPAERAARRLCPSAVRGVATAGGGGNSRLYQVIAADGRRFALKSYPPRANDPRDRLGQEFAALRFVAGLDGGHGRVPAPVARDDVDGFGLYEWIEGAAVGAPAAADIDAMLDFAAWLFAARSAPGAETLAAASEACLSLSEIARQIHGRQGKLAAVAHDHEDLADWLFRRFAPLLDRALARAENLYRLAGIDPAANIAPAQQTLSPSDFGVHNALRLGNGRLLFLDFEYFGWDDPVRLTADVAWHPAMALPDGLARRFVAGCRALFAADPDFPARLAAQGPLVGLRWCMIILNEFLPERWAGRVHAGQDQGRQDVLRRQLCKANLFLERVGLSMHDTLFASGDDGHGG